MERIFTPVRRFISRGLSFPTLPTLPRFGSSENANSQEPLPSAGKRQREADEEEEDNGGPAKRVKMEVDSQTPTATPSQSQTPAPSFANAGPVEDMTPVEEIRPQVAGLSLAASTPPGSPAPSKSAPSTPGGRTKYQRTLRGTRKSETAAASKPRLGPKRQCALLVGFCGTGYSGMQIQKEHKTIEGQLFNALVKIGSVSEDNSDDPTKVNIQRSARTDAGVHAARNIVSIKIIMEVPGVPNLVERLNQELPPEIRVWDIVRTQNSFNSRTSCDSRKYTYFLPTYMLTPPAPDSSTSQALRNAEEDPYDSSTHPFWKGVSGQPITPETTLFMFRKKYRVDKETLSNFKDILEAYLGTHNFWNFTVGREYKDAASKRHIKSIEVTDPAIYGNTEWISVQIHGQSFMLHQIRKMIGFAVLLTRSQGEPNLVNKAYGPTRVRIPKAPALGLLLEEPVFDVYNQKIATANAKWRDVATNGKGKSPASTKKGAKEVKEEETDEDKEHAANFIRDPIDFSKYKDTIEEFKKKHIYEQMQKTEEEQGTFDAWLGSIDQHEARLYYEARHLPIPSELSPAGKVTRNAAINDGDESDDALGKGKINFKNPDLEG